MTTLEIGDVLLEMISQKPMGNNVIAMAKRVVYEAAARGSEEDSSVLITNVKELLRGNVACYKK
jgi:hypothetical protein